MNRRYICIICLLLCGMLLISGCSALYEDTDLSEIPDVDAMYLQNSDIPRNESHVIYYYNEDGLLEGEVHDIIIYPGQNEETILMNEILEDAEDSMLSTAMKAKLNDIEVLDDVVNVYLETTSGSNKQKYLLASQIADTFIDALNVEFVCVFFNGKTIGIDGYAVGALKKSDGDPAADYERRRAEYADIATAEGEAALYVPLYFLNSTCEYFIPETRKVTIQGKFSSADEFNEAVIKNTIGALADGPNSKYYLSTYITKKYLEGNNYSLKYEDGGIYVERTQEIFITNYAAETAAFYYTIAGLIPLERDISITKRDEMITVSREGSSKYAGALLTVYIPNAEADGLECVSRIVSEERARDLITYVQEIFTAIEESGYFNGKAGFTSDFVSGIRRDEDIAIVDLTGKFFSLTKELSDKEQELIVFSIVNTLDATGEVKLTAIRKGGEVPNDFAKNLELEFPLMPNYGIVK